MRRILIAALIALPLAACAGSKEPIAKQYYLKMPRHSASPRLRLRVLRLSGSILHPTLMKRALR